MAMAKKKAAGDSDKPKKRKAGKAKAAGAAPKAKRGGAKRKSGASSVDAILKLAEHPIVADLIAVGATAAVAAIASGRSDKAKGGSAQAVKAAGKAAASAIGARLVEEFKAVKQSAGEAARKRDQK
jgi:hypothetical protein